MSYNARIYVGYQIYISFFLAIALPIYSWDSIYVIAPKAKILFYNGSMDQIKLLPLSSYPLQVPFSMTWVSFCLGVWDDQMVKIIFPLIFLCFVVIYFEFLKLLTNVRWALLGTVLLASSNLLTYHASIVYQDIFVMFYNMVSLILIFYGSIKKVYGGESVVGQWS